MIKKAIISLLMAIGFLGLILASSVKLKKKGIFHIVAIVTKNNMKEIIKTAVMMLFHISSWQ